MKCTNLIGPSGITFFGIDRGHDDFVLDDAEFWSQSPVGPISSPRFDSNRLPPPVKGRFSVMVLRKKRRNSGISRIGNP